MVSIINQLIYIYVNSANLVVPIMLPSNKTSLNSYFYCLLQIIQREIESKGNLVKSLLKRCDQLLLLERAEGQTSAATATVSADSSVASNDLPGKSAPSIAKSCLQTSHQPQPPSLLSSLANQPRSVSKSSSSRIGLDITRVARIAANLEKRWHSLWLRSLEWQCFFEQLLGTREQQENGQNQDKVGLVRLR